MRVGVEVLSRFEQHDVRLRLGEIAKAHRVLNTDLHSVTEHAMKKGARPIYCSCVRAANWTRLNDLSFDQLDAVVWRKESDFGHSVVIANVEVTLLKLN